MILKPDKEVGVKISDEKALGEPARKRAFVMQEPIAFDGSRAFDLDRLCWRKVSVFRCPSKNEPLDH